MRHGGRCRRSACAESPWPVRGPKKHINIGVNSKDSDNDNGNHDSIVAIMMRSVRIRILHSGSKAQDKGYSGNHGL